MIEDIIKSLAQPMEPVPTEVSPRLGQLDGIQAVLFDIYGTLLISGSGDVGVATKMSKPDAFLDALRAAGQHYSGEAEAGLDAFHDEIAKEHATLKADGIDFPEVRIGEIWSRVIAGWHQSGHSDSEADPEVVQRLAIEYEMRVNPVWTMPGLVDTLSALGASGKTLGIVSNAQVFTRKLFEPLTGKTLDGLGFVGELCFWSYEHRHAKPGTYLYEQAADVLLACGLSPESTLYVGNDMRNDIWPASRVGFKTALFAGDQRSLRMREDDADVADTVPDVIVTELSQLLNVV